MREKVSNKGLGTIAFPRIFLSNFTSIGQQFDLAIVLMFFKNSLGFILEGRENFQREEIHRIVFLLPNILGRKISATVVRAT